MFFFPTTKFNFTTMLLRSYLHTQRCVYIFSIFYFMLFPLQHKNLLFNVICMPFISFPNFFSCSVFFINELSKYGRDVFIIMWSWFVCMIYGELFEHYVTSQRISNYMYMNISKYKPTIRRHCYVLFVIYIQQRSVLWTRLNFSLSPK